MAAQHIRGVSPYPLVIVCITHQRSGGRSNPDFSEIVQERHFAFARSMRVIPVHPKLILELRKEVALQHVSRPVIGVTLLK
jgi:hypothetical protein